jgi:raffinose synthase
MLIEIKESRNQQQNSPVIYTVLLPLLEGQFRAVLQGNDKNEIEICLESGEFQTWNDVREAND